MATARHVSPPSYTSRPPCIATRGDFGHKVNTEVVDCGVAKPEQNLRVVDVEARMRFQSDADSEILSAMLRGLPLRHQLLGPLPLKSLAVLGRAKQQ